MQVSAKVRSWLMAGFFVSAGYEGAIAQESNAQQAAENVLRALAAQKFQHVWTDMTSDWGHKNWTQDSFLSTMTLQRPMLGNLLDLTVVGRDHFNHDPSTNVDGDIYVITFRSKYTAGEFYEKIVVIKDTDGQYRLSGIYGAPIPQN